MKPPTRSGTVVTSLPPRGLTDDRVASLERNLASFRANGFGTLSINLESEAPDLSSRFPDVAFAIAGRDRIVTDRFGPSLGSAFTVCPDDACAVINADIRMLPSNIGDVGREFPEAFFVAHRMDVDQSGRDIVGVFRLGIDAIYFRKSAYAALMDDPDVCRFQFGAPFWDLIIPVVASFHGPVIFIDPPFILHPIHDAHWSRADCDRMRDIGLPIILRNAERHADKPAARTFLDGFYGCLGRSPDFRDRNTARMGGLLIEQWLLRIDAQTARRIDVDIGDAFSDAAADTLRRGGRIPDSPLPEEWTAPPATLLKRMNEVFKARRRRRRALIAEGVFASVRF